MVRRFWIGALIIGSFLVISVLPLSEGTRGGLLGLLIFFTLTHYMSENYGYLTLAQIVKRETVIKWTLPIGLAYLATSVWFLHSWDTDASFLTALASTFLWMVANTLVLLAITARMAPTDPEDES